MKWFEALILGLVQGFTEFLPVSSSGHLELGNALFHIQGSEHLTFAIVVHGATVLSIIVVFFKDIKTIFIDSLRFKWNDSVRYLLKILISLIPVAFVGVFLREQVEALFTGNILLVGCMLLVTATILIVTISVPPGTKNIPWLHSFIIGIAQAVAVIPGISRSGATIATGLLLGNKKDEVTRFSFLMVLIPIIGANLLDLFGGEPAAGNQVGTIPLLVGFVAAFISGLIACRWMINIVRKGRLIYFGIYCFIIGTIAIIASIL
jgi:undecaprenyl-diphosphatase